MVTIRAIQAVRWMSVCRTCRENQNYREALCVVAHLHKAYGVFLLNKLSFNELLECSIELLKYLFSWKDTWLHVHVKVFSKNINKTVILHKYQLSKFGIKLKSDSSSSVNKRFMVIRLPRHLDEVTLHAGNCTYSEMKKWYSLPTQSVLREEYCWGMWWFLDCTVKHCIHKTALGLINLHSIKKFLCFWYLF